MKSDVSSRFLPCRACQWGPFPWYDGIILLIWWQFWLADLVEYFDFPLTNSDLRVLSAWTKFWCQHMPTNFGIKWFYSKVSSSWLLHVPQLQPSALNAMLISLASFDQGHDVWSLDDDHPFNLLIHPSFLNLCSTTDLLSSPRFGRYMFYLRSNSCTLVIASSNWPPFQAWSISQLSEL